MYDQTNGDPNGTPLSVDNMEAFDRLPAELRTFIANSIAPWNSQMAADMLRSGGLDYVMRALRNSEKIQHDGAVKAGVIPKVKYYRFALERRCDESPVEIAKRERAEIRAFRYRFKHRTIRE